MPLFACALLGWSRGTIGLKFPNIGEVELDIDELLRPNFIFNGYKPTNYLMLQSLMQIHLRHKSRGNPENGKIGHSQTRAHGEKSENCLLSDDCAIPELISFVWICSEYEDL